MKKRNTLTLILLFAALTVAAQSNYSPCYTNNIAKGDAAFKQGKYSEARTYYVTAKQCNGGNPSVAQQKINSCDAKIKAQKEAAEAKRKAEQEAEAKRKADEEAARQRAIAEAKARGYEDITVNGVIFKMIYVEGGTFSMGCTVWPGGECGNDETPIHSVTLSDFFIGETEVTQALWKAVMGDNPSNFKGDNLPVDNVSWNDCLEFVQKLNELTDMEFRLPTEAEWEYAARGGNKSQRYTYAGSNDIDKVAWYDNNSGKETHPVKTKKANELGLYDMTGNVDEWCSDWYGDYSSSAQTNPQGPSSSSDPVFTNGSRVYRGGSCSGCGWYPSYWYCRVSRRGRIPPDSRGSNTGFRLALTRQ